MSRRIRIMLNLRPLIKKIGWVVLVLTLTTVAYAQTIVSYGNLYTPFNATTLTGSAFNSGVYALPAQNSATITWTTAFGSTPSAISIILQGSLDNSNWFNIDSTSSTSAASADTSSGGYRYLRVRVASSSGGTTITVKFSAKQGAGSSGGGGVSADVTIDGVSTTDPLHTVCDSGCGGGQTADDDGSIPGATTNLNSNALNMAWTGSAWSRIAFGQAVMNSSIPVVLASNQSSIPVTGTFWQATQPVSNAGTFATQAAQSGTWTVQPGNTANSTAWRFEGLVTPADNMSPTNAAPVINYNMCWDSSNSNWDRCVDGPLPAGTNNIGDVDVASIAAGNNNIGDVDVASLPATPAGSNLIGQVNDVATATTTNATTPFAFVSAASTNSTNVKNGSGNLYGIYLVNTTATIYYLRFYNASSAPTCSSATNFVLSIPIPASASGAGISFSFDKGVAFSTGISYCFTGGSSSTDNTNAATGILGMLTYK